MKRTALSIAFACSATFAFAEDQTTFTPDQDVIEVVAGSCSSGLLACKKWGYTIQFGPDAVPGEDGFPKLPEQTG